jgi:alkanesulfonate monooxygenase SsuD/methylene tetrahydromethanopterin reductase-like flavin-dependent oxidoreductase (luciferase family)
MFTLGITDHLEGPRDQPSASIFAEVADLIRLADRLGVQYAWFSEHHAHAHEGHLPAPLLLALHLAGQTRNICLGTAIICLNLHHPLAIAEQVAVADLLAKGRLAVGFGSGSTPEEFALFGLKETDEPERHARFEEALEIICSAWNGKGAVIEPRYYAIRPHSFLPIPAVDLHRRSWVAVNSLGAAQIAGKLNFNMLFSHLRTPEQYRQYRAAYQGAGGSGLVAANRPVFVGLDDVTAFAQAEPALRLLWRRFRQEGKIPANTPEPPSPAALCDHPINFIVGGPKTVARQLQQLHEQAPYDVANLELRWAGLPHDLVCESLRRLVEEVLPLVRSDEHQT